MLNRIELIRHNILAELEYKAKRISGWRFDRRASLLPRDNQPAISGLHPTAHERRGGEQRSAIALKLIFGYLNCRPSNIAVKYRTERGAIVEKIQYCILILWPL